jgi:hypothetical protein
LTNQTPTRDKDGLEETQQDFGERLRELILFCSDHDARNWKEIWWDWTYSETLEFYFQLRKRRRELMEELSAIEDPIQLILTLLINKGL